MFSVTGCTGGLCGVSCLRLTPGVVFLNELEWHSQPCNAFFPTKPMDCFIFLFSLVFSFQHPPSWRSCSYEHHSRFHKPPPLAHFDRLETKQSWGCSAVVSAAGCVFSVIKTSAASRSVIKRSVKDFTSSAYSLLDGPADASGIKSFYHCLYTHSTDNPNFKKSNNCMRYLLHTKRLYLIA